MLKMVSLVLGLLIVAPAVQAAECTHDRKTLLAQDYTAFDQDMHGGWRPLAWEKGCEAIAADLIRDYRQAHTGLSSENLWNLSWHEGQLRAGFGDYAGAIPLLSVDNPDPAMRDYAAATVAFLKRDKAGLLLARTHLVALPKPENWDAEAADFKARYGITIVWPSNLDVVDGLIACFDKTYAEAYGDMTCRAKPAT